MSPFVLPFETKGMEIIFQGKLQLTYNFTANDNYIGLTTVYVVIWFDNVRW